MEECDLIKEDAESLLKRADGSLQKAIEPPLSCLKCNFALIVH